MYRIHSFLHIFIYLFIASFSYSPIYHLEFSKIRLQLKRRKLFLLYFILNHFPWYLNNYRICSIQYFEDENVAQKITFIPTDVAICLYLYISSREILKSIFENLKNEVPWPRLGPSILSVAIELLLRVRSYPLGHTVHLFTKCVLKTIIFLDLNKLLSTIDFTNL